MVSKALKVVFVCLVVLAVLVLLYIMLLKKPADTAGDQVQRIDDPQEAATASHEVVAEQPRESNPTQELSIPRSIRRPPCKPFGFVFWEDGTKVGGADVEILVQGSNWGERNLWTTSGVLTEADGRSSAIGLAV